MEVGRRLDLG